MTIENLIQRIENSTQHKYLYHFTDEANFSSIDQKGLVSKAFMREENWWPHATGGNALSHQLDDHHGISEYVSLCFTKNHPMMYLAQQGGRLPNPRHLAISPEVLRIQGVQIAFGVANSNDVEILPVEDALNRLDVEVLYERTNWSNSAIQARLRAAEKFEILVPNTVPRNLIVGVY